MSTENPYVGPIALDIGRKIHGRDVEIEDLRDLLLAERIVLLYGSSGVGKTSLIQAGLIPQLEANDIKVLLIKGLRGRGDGAGKRYWLEFVRQVEAQGGANHVDRSRDDAAEVIFIFDQFEDVFRDPLRDEQRADFMLDIGNLLLRRNTFALFSMHEDRIAKLDEYLHLIPTRLASHFRLRSLDPDSARLVIVETAKEQHVEYADKAAEQLVDDLRMTFRPEKGSAKERQLGNRIEPVQLQVVCHQLWERRFSPDREPPPGAITVEDVKSVSVDSALEEFYASKVRAAADNAEKRVPERIVREWVEDQLIIPTGIRGQVLLGTEETAGLANRVIEILEDANVVRVETHGDRRWCELIHDRLIGPVLHNNRIWFDRNLALLQLRTREWIRAQRPDRFLLSTREWLQALRWRFSHRDELRPEEHQFWKRSCKTLVRRAGVSFGVLILVGMSVWWVVRMKNLQDASTQLSMQVKLESVKERGSEHALDHGLIEGALAAKEVTRLPRRGLRKRLGFSVRRSLMSVLNAASDVRGVVVRDNVRLKAVAVHPKSFLFAYGGTGGAVMFHPSGPSDVACQNQADVHSLAFNPQGTLLALGCEDGTVQVWSTLDWKRVADWRAHEKKTLVVAFDRNGTTVASGGEDNTIKVMPLRPGDGVRTSEKPKSLKTEPTERIKKVSGGVWSMAFSPKEDSLVVGDGVGDLWLCDLRDGDKCEVKQEGRPDLPRGRNDAVVAVAFKQDGTCIASGSWKGDVSLWDGRLTSSVRLQEAGTKKMERLLSLIFTEKKHGLAVGWTNRLYFHLLDSTACAPDTGSASRRDALSSREKEILFGDEVTGLALHEDGTLAATTAVGYLALADVDRTHERIRKVVRRQDIREILDQVEKFEEEGWRGALATDDGAMSRLVVGREHFDKLLVVSIGKDGKPWIDDQPVSTGQGGVRRVTASVSKQRVATLGEDGSIKFWRLDHAKLAPDPSVSTEPIAWKLANDAAGNERQPPFRESASEQQRNPERILLNPAGDLIACLFKNKPGILMINLLDRLASKWVSTTEGITPSEIAFSDDGALFAAGSDRVLVWDVTAAHQIKLKVGPMRVTPLASRVSELALATTRAGKDIVIAGGDNGQLLAWDAKTGSLLQKLRTDSRQVQQMTFLKSEDLLAAADSFGRVTLWDVSFGEVTMCDTLWYTLMTLCHRLVEILPRGETRNTGEWQSAEFPRPKSVRKMRFLSFASGGRFLVSGDDDLTVWDIDEESLRNKICNILLPSGDASKRVADACAPAATQ